MSRPFDESIGECVRELRPDVVVFYKAESGDHARLLEQKVNEDAATIPGCEVLRVCHKDLASLPQQVGSTDKEIELWVEMCREREIERAVNIHDDGGIVPDEFELSLIKKMRSNRTNKVLLVDSTDDDVFVEHVAAMNKAGCHVHFTAHTRTKNGLPA